MESIPSNKIIVLGGAHHNGLGIIRSLGEIGYNIYFISLICEGNYVTKSKYIKKSWLLSSEEEIVEVLFKEFQGDSKKTIIIPSDDWSAHFIDLNYKILKDEFFLPSITNIDYTLSDLMNKITMNEFATKHGLLVPKSCQINLEIDNEKVLDKIKEEIGYPCILKPIQSIDGGKSDILVFNDDKKLRKSLKKLKLKYKNIIVQQYILKQGEIGIQGVSTNTSNNVYISGIVDKIRVSSISPGSTTYAKLIDKHSLIDEEKIESLIKDLGFKGIFDIEFLYSGKEIYFIEMNFRNGAYGYAFTRAGVNLPSIWCQDIVGNKINSIVRINKSITLMNEFADFRNVLNKEINFKKWFLELLKSDIYLVFNLKDLKPWFYKMLYR